APARLEARGPGQDTRFEYRPVADQRLACHGLREALDQPPAEAMDAAPALRAHALPQRSLGGVGHPPPGGCYRARSGILKSGACPALSRAVCAKSRGLTTPHVVAPSLRHRLDRPRLWRLALPAAPRPGARRAEP